MKKPDADTPAISKPSSSPTKDPARVIGLSIVTLIVVFATAWLYVRGRAAIASPQRPSTGTMEAVNDARFRADAWYLPDEPTLGFVEIPAGTFVMGSDPAIDRAAYENERWSSSQHQHHLELSTFYIGRYETTVAQFGAFVSATNRVVDSQTLRAPGNHPVTHVTWPDAIAYAAWLEAQLKNSPQTPAPLVALLKDGWHFSLPDEAQWEKAARNTDGRIFPWGDEPNPEKANFGRSGTMPVGSFACPECPFALADMSGNVWELTRSPFQPYPYTNDEPRDPQADALFVMRGGAFNDAPNNVRTAIRGGIDPGARRPFIGFRLVLSKINLEVTAKKE
ncbi:MAG TPA: SUMF1/EgtB/PvdO family nonheme iron enzyme [Steroidobacteraceae bacterium]|nr:SUMF1/EgtB/PvdO family nonheme iron enzyme [Steroidobacteraceae bacterium]